MGCCVGAKYGNWCEDVDIVWTSPETGDEYCLFHAPKEHKGDIPSDFFTEYIKKNKDKELIDMRGSIVTQHLAMKDITLKNLDLSGSQFSYYCMFHTCELNELCLTNATHKYGLSIVDTNLKSIKLNNTTISEYLDFRDVYCKNLLSLENITSDLILKFSFSTPPKRIHASNVTAIKTIFRAPKDSHNKTSLFTITDKPDRSATSFVFDNIKVSSLNYEHMNSLFIFNECIFDQLVFQRDNQGIFNYCTFKETQFEASALSNIEFYGCTFPIHKNKRFYAHHQNALEFGNVHSYEELYRRLKNKAQNEENKMLASDWHYWEKRFCQKRLFKQRAYLQFIILWIYRLLSDYGENVGKAAWCLLIFILTPFLFNVIVQEQPDTFFTSWWITAGQNALDYIPLATRVPEDVKTIPRLLQIAWQILITFQATLLGFALRNKYRR